MLYISKRSLLCHKSGYMFSAPAMVRGISPWLGVYRHGSGYIAMVRGISPWFGVYRHGSGDIAMAPSVYRYMISVSVKHVALWHTSAGINHWCISTRLLVLNMRV